MTSKRLHLPSLLAGITGTALLAFTLRTETPACVISLDKMNILYCGIDNPAAILVRGVPEAEVHIQTSENLTLKNERGLWYTLRASAPGEGTITVSGGDLKPVSFRYRIKRIPDPLLRLGGRHGSRTIGNGEFRAQGGLAAVIEDFDIDARCALTSFKMLHLREGRLLAEATNTGARYDATVQPIIDSARPGDTYIFQEVKVRCPGDQAARILDETLTFVIR